MDVFGYQELLEKDVKFRSCSVKCLKNESQVVSINKSVLAGIIRRNPLALELMKQDWTKFLIERVSNKLLVEHLIIRE